MDKIITLRAHHLLCLQGFQGYGYSKKFVDNLASIINKIDSETFVKITTSTDDICAACPHQKNNICDKNNDGGAEIRNFDRKVLDRLNIDKNQVGTAEMIFDYIKRMIKDNAIFNHLCGDCDWKEKCSVRNK